jgi:phosphoribosylanthranilate isomerase
MKPEIKICGIKTKEALMAAINNKADFAGFVFYQKSPRYIKPEQAATLSNIAKNKIKRVGLFIEPSEDTIKKHLDVVDLDFIQIHGNVDVKQLEKLKNKFKKPIIFAIPIKTQSDIKRSKSYLKVAEIILFDTKIEGLHGGSGKSFDWSLLQDFVSNNLWALAGGINKNNIQEALSKLSPDMIDVSSGVEEKLGVKSPKKIKEFIEEVKKND